MDRRHRMRHNNSPTTRLDFKKPLPRPPANNDISLDFEETINEPKQEKGRVLKKARDRSNELFTQKGDKNRIIAFKNYSKINPEPRVEPNYQDQDETASFNISPIAPKEDSWKAYKTCAINKKTKLECQKDSNPCTKTCQPGFKPDYEIATPNIGFHPKTMTTINPYFGSRQEVKHEKASEVVSSPEISLIMHENNDSLMCDSSVENVIDQNEKHCLTNSSFKSKKAPPVIQKEFRLKNNTLVGTKCNKWEKHYTRSVKIDLTTDKGSSDGSRADSIRSQKMTWRDKAKLFKVTLQKKQNSENGGQGRRTHKQKSGSSMYNKTQRMTAVGNGKKIHPALVPPRNRKKIRLQQERNYIPISSPGKKVKPDEESRPSAIKRDHDNSWMKASSRASHNYSIHTSRSTMNRSISRREKSLEKSLQRGSQVVDVKCINCGIYIPEDKVASHSQGCGNVSTTVKYSQKLSKITHIQSELRGLRKAITDTIDNIKEEDDTHYFIKLREIISDILSIKTFDDKACDLLKFIQKDICCLYDTCEGNANTILYIERIAEITDALADETNLKTNSTVKTNGLKSALKPTKKAFTERNSSINSKDSERLTLLNTRKNELISLKRKTLGLMNQLIHKKQRPSHMNLHSSSLYKTFDNPDAHKVRFSGYTRSQNVRKTATNTNVMRLESMNREYYEN
ncbi:unnamed protein product [Moneuplotes crassus]|uniref:Uncharacterized protein n=1 Tax=Euplotes crassus TaxID=5936 RepID=A0AAD1Y688_EUPCR|nr:unnamed protein product [Moneuplotes crassus]